LLQKSRGQQFPFTLMARFDAPSNDRINIALAINLRTSIGVKQFLLDFWEVAKFILKLKRLTTQEHARVRR
jgi:hypothetical protein